MIAADERLPVTTKAALVAEILVTYTQARWMLKRRGLREALEDLRGHPRAVNCQPLRAASRELRAARRLGHVVTRTLSPLPSDTRCLMRSLVLTRVLARRGIESRLVIGVHPGERFAAHAWLEHDGAALLPTGGADFDELVTL
jgi:hypothetical protein